EGGITRQPGPSIGRLHGRPPSMENSTFRVDQSYVTLPRSRDAVARKPCSQ
ncbi:hypothetical protein CRENBAI_004673, partial [Crenichthys baileyi]